MTNEQAITVRRSAWGEGPADPAINVKESTFPSVDTVVDRFGCSEATAQTALEIAWDCQAEGFWDQAEETANELLGAAFPDRPLTVYQEGRSGGWLTVQYRPVDNLHGACNALPDVQGWSRKQRQAWRRFERAIEDEIAFRVSEGNVLDLIACNEWAMDDASLSRMIGEALS